MAKQMSPNRHHRITWAWILSVVTATLLVAQASPTPRSSSSPTGIDPRGAQQSRSRSLPFREARGAVYAMTNEAEGNRIAVFARLVDGTLRAPWYVPTGGLGSGAEPPLEAFDALGSQNPLILSKDGRWLFAVNAGSDEISVFEVRDRWPRLTDVVYSGGRFPVSLTFDGEVLYVLNSALAGNISGFSLDGDGRLTPIEDSTRTLGLAGIDPPFFIVSPGQIGFSPLGDFLAVTVKGSDRVYTFPVSPDGRVGETPRVNASFGKTPSGFVFDPRGHLVIAEAFGQGIVGQAEVGAVSSYRLGADGSLEVVSGSVNSLQSGNQWLAILPGGRFAYSTCAASEIVTGYRINRMGELSLLEPDGVSAQTGHFPVDVAASEDGRFVYVVNSGDGTISMFAVNPGNGSLTPLGTVAGLPVENGAVGIAAR